MSFSLYVSSQPWTAARSAGRTPHKNRHTHRHAQTHRHNRGQTEAHAHRPMASCKDRGCVWCRCDAVGCGSDGGGRWKGAHMTSHTSARTSTGAVDGCVRQWHAHSRKGVHTRATRTQTRPNTRTGGQNSVLTSERTPPAPTFVQPHARPPRRGHGPHTHCRNDGTLKTPQTATAASNTPHSDWKASNMAPDTAATQSAKRKQRGVARVCEGWMRQTARRKNSRGSDFALTIFKGRLEDAGKSRRRRVSHGVGGGRG